MCCILIINRVSYLFILFNHTVTEVVDLLKKNFVFVRKIVTYVKKLFSSSIFSYIFNNYWCNHNNFPLNFYWAVSCLLIYATIFLLFSHLLHLHILYIILLLWCFYMFLLCWSPVHMSYSYLTVKFVLLSKVVAEFPGCLALQSTHRWRLSGSSLLPLYAVIPQPKQNI